MKIIAANNRANHNFTISNKIEAGIVLTGSEVKSLRTNTGSIRGSYIIEQNGELWLSNAFIKKYQNSNDIDYDPSRNRKLLVTKKEFNKISGSIKQGGFTIIPISLYFSDKGIAKLTCGIAKGKKKIDKRQSIKERDWNIKKQRLLKIINYLLLNFDHYKPHMARITVEDCIDKFPSRFELVLVASNRARKLHSGEEPSVEKDNDKNTVIALREIADETITVENLKNDLISEYQNNTFTEDEDIDEIEDSNDENQSEESKLEINGTDQNKENINEPIEETPIESSQDNLENSSDEDK